MSVDALNDLTRILTLAAVVAYATISLLDVHKAPPHKRMLRALSGIVYMYLAGIYISALAGNNSYLLISGLLTRIAVLVIATLGTTEIVLDNVDLRRTTRKALENDGPNHAD